MAIRAEDIHKPRQRHMALDSRFGAPEDEQPAPINPLDSPEAKKKLAKLKEWWSETRTSHSENRAQQAIDADFYDGLQWDDRDIEILRERGQAPLVFNKIAQHINWILGTERRTRVDFKVQPRKDNQEPEARAKTELLKFVSDVNKAQFKRSRAFSDTMKVGIGWLEDGIRSDPRDEPLFSRTESWRNMWWDALAQESDLSDARYIFRVKWVDTDITEAMFPDRKAQVKQSARQDDLLFHEEDDEFNFTSLYPDHQGGHPIFNRGRSFLDASFNIGNRRSRNKLVECWYRQPTPGTFLRTRPHALMVPELLNGLQGINGMQFDENSPEQNRLIENGMASTYDAVKMMVWVAIWSGESLLQDVQSPYEHDRFPFTPIWAYRRNRDNMPYGPIRNMRDPQEDLNKRQSKALFILSTNQLIGDEDAFEDWDEAAEEAARPDGVLKHKRGATFEINRNIDLAVEHVTLMQQDMQFLESASGVTEENLGEVTNTNSGTAINLRQTQGSVVTATLFDNLREAIQHQGETQLSLIEQFYNEPKIIRITNDVKRTEFVGVNQLGQSDDGELFVDNPITESQADFIVDTQDFRESIRLAMFDQLMEMTTRLDPQVTMQILDLIIDLSDLPGKDELVRRIRRINGQTDPDDPERDKIEAEADAKTEEQEDRANRAAEATIAKDLATAGKSDATAAADTAKAGTDKSATMQAALEIVASLQGNPKLAQAVDILMSSLESGALPQLLPATAPGAPEETLEIETVFTEAEEAESLPAPTS